jgi:hypothetical protein
MLPIDDPKALSELTAAFDAYERALTRNDIEIVNELFWNDPRTVRYGTRVVERQYGHAEISEFRIRRGPVDQRRELANRRITTFGRDFGVTATEFRAVGSDKIGRQTQSWIRTPRGWKIACAHVSYGVE